MGPVGEAHGTWGHHSGSRRRQLIDKERSDRLLNDLRAYTGVRMQDVWSLPSGEDHGVYRKRDSGELCLAVIIPAHCDSVYQSGFTVQEEGGG